MPNLRLALPNKGRMYHAVLELLSDAGLEVRGGRHERALVAQIGDDIEALFVRAGDIPELVADGVVDAGITGWDLVCESDQDLDVLLDLQLGRCSLVVATPTSAGIDSVRDIPDHSRVATAFPHLTVKFFASRNKQIVVVPVSGAAEAAPQLGIADAVVDLSSTGSTMKMNGLQQIDRVLESSARLITRPAREDNRYLDELTVALQSVLEAKDKRYLMANIPRESVPQLMGVLPGLNGPTVVDILDNEHAVAVHAVVDAHELYRTIAELKALRAEGILITRIERLMP